MCQILEETVDKKGSVTSSWINQKLVHPCRHTMLFQRQCDVVGCRVTSHWRWNDVVCLQGLIAWRWKQENNINKRHNPIQTFQFNIQRSWNQISRAKCIELKLWPSCFSVNFAKFLRTAFLQNTSGWLLSLTW